MNRSKIVDVPVPQDDVLQALQFQALANSHEIQRKRSNVESGKKEFVTKTHELAKQWGCVLHEDRRIAGEKSGFLGQVGDQGYDPFVLLNKQVGVLMEEKQFRCRPSVDFSGDSSKNRRASASEVEKDL